MDWKARAKALGQPAEQAQAAERRKEEQQKAVQSEYVRVVEKLSPRVEKVCKIFAQSVCGWLDTKAERIGQNPYPGTWTNPRPNVFWISRPGGSKTRVLIIGVLTDDRYAVKVEIQDYCSIPLAEFAEDKLGEALVSKMERELRITGG